MSETLKPVRSSEADAAGRAAAPVRVGMFPPLGLLEQDPETARAYLMRVAAAGIDHICCGDHVSFFDGTGFDGLVQAAALAMLHPALPVYTGVYLLPLRHPVLVARQLADIARIAPGRLVFGTGIGGEDRHEVAVCGVDPASRGRRMNECLTVVRQLLTGKAVTFHGTFFDLDEAVISPAPAEPIPIIVGGRSDAAARRAGRLGDGWLGIWNSSRRFAAAVELAADEAARAGPVRATEPARDAGMVRARQYEGGGPRLPRTGNGSVLPATVRALRTVLPLRHSDDVAEFLAAYATAGCREFNLIPQAPDHDYAIAGTASVKRALERA